jgi:surface protein
MEDFSTLFENAIGFDADLSSWDTSNVKNMSGTFKGVKGFHWDSIRQWNTSNVVDFSHLFEDSDMAGDLTQWDTRNGRYFQDMFHKASLFDVNLAPLMWSDAYGLDPSSTHQPVVLPPQTIEQQRQEAVDPYQWYQEDDAWVPDFSDDVQNDFQSIITRERTNDPSSALYAGFLSCAIAAVATFVVACSRWGRGGVPI